MTRSSTYLSDARAFPIAASLLQAIVSYNKDLMQSLVLSEYNNFKSSMAKFEQEDSPKHKQEQLETAVTKCHEVRNQLSEWRSAAVGGAQPLMPYQVPLGCGGSEVMQRKVFT